MLGDSTQNYNRSQFMLKPDPKYKDMKNQGRHFILDKKNPVEIEWDKFIFEDVKGTHIKCCDLEGDLLRMI